MWENPSLQQHKFKCSNFHSIEREHKVREKEGKSLLCGGKISSHLSARAAAAMLIAFAWEMIISQFLFWFAFSFIRQHKNVDFQEREKKPRLWYHWQGHICGLVVVAGVLSRSPTWEWKKGSLETLCNDIQKYFLHFHYFYCNNWTALNNLISSEKAFHSQCSCNDLNIFKIHFQSNSTVVMSCWLIPENVNWRNQYFASLKSRLTNITTRNLISSLESMNIHSSDNWLQTFKCIFVN